MFELSGKRVWVAGHRGMVGSAIVRRLARESCEVLVAPRNELDLTNQAQVADWMSRARPDAVVLAAAKVGGILANDTYPADFLFENLMIEANVIHGAYRNQVQKLLFLGSSCVYPKFAPQPIQEDALLSGPLEPTNEWYAVAKIAGIKLAQAYRRQHGCDFISAMPTNLYGPQDNFDAQGSHVLPALIRKAHLAKLANEPSITIWGTGAPLREFLHVDDCADACVHLLRTYSDDLHANVGSGEEISIYDLARLICEAVGFAGDVQTAPELPDGTPRKLMDSGILRSLGWSPGVDLPTGVRSTYEWYCSELASGRVRGELVPGG